MGGGSGAPTCSMAWCAKPAAWGGTWRRLPPPGSPNTQTLPPHHPAPQHPLPGCGLSSARLCRRFLHEYVSSYGQAPLPVLLASTRTFLSMVSTCCISPTPTACFLKEVRLLGAPGSSAASWASSVPAAQGEVAGEGWRLPGGHLWHLLVAETGKERRLPPHADVKPGLLPLRSVREGQCRPRVKKRNVLSSP